MAATQIVTILDSWNEFQNKWGDVFKSFQELKTENGECLDLTLPISGLNLSLSELDSHISICGDLLNSLSSVESVKAVPENYLNDLQNLSTNLLSSTIEVARGLESVTNDGGLGQIDQSNHTFTSKNGSTSVNLPSALQKFRAQLNAAKHHYYLLNNIVRSEGYIDFARSIERIDTAVEHARNAIRLTDAERLELNKKYDEALTAISNEAAQAAQARKESLSSQAAIDAILKESRVNQDAIIKYSTESGSKAAEVTQAHEKANSLDQAVTAYQAKFEQFDKELAAREKSLKEGTQSQADLLKKIGERDKQVVALISRSNEMLSGATTAALATSFAIRRDNLTTELAQARKSFYFAIGILFISAIPLLLFILPDFSLDSMSGFDQGATTGQGTITNQSLSKTSQQTQNADDIWQFIGKVFARAILLLPGAWLTTFAAARHSRLFRLREHYAYKSSIAESVDGFKKQAESHADDIAAASFFALTENPADSMEKNSEDSGERNPNPLMQKIMEKIGMNYAGKP